jgi:hypothetical protein
MFVVLKYSIYFQFNGMPSSVLGKTLKKGIEKVCEIEKECYFCTRNEDDVLTIY